MVTNQDVMSALHAMAKPFESMVETHWRGNWGGCGPASRSLMLVLEKRFPGAGLTFHQMPCRVVSFSDNDPQTHVTFLALNDAANEARRELRQELHMSPEDIDSAFNHVEFCTGLGPLHRDLKNGKLNPATLKTWVKALPSAEDQDRPAIEKLAEKILQKIEQGKIDKSRLGRMEARWGHTVAVIRVPGENKDILLDFTTKQFEGNYPLVAHQLDFAYPAKEDGTAKALVAQNIGYVTEGAATFRNAAETIKKDGDLLEGAQQVAMQMAERLQAAAAAGPGRGSPSSDPRALPPKNWTDGV